VYLEGKDQITNAEVEELLDVSDATATRYLDTLEDEGLVVQKDAGRSTYYEIR
jgi:Fic family protein